MPADPIRDREKIAEIKANLGEMGPNGRRKRLRDYALFCCGINWALRVSDLSKLTIGDVMNGHGLREFFQVRQTKTRKTVRVPITNNCRDALILYLNERPSLGGHPATDDAEAPLFPSRKHTHDGLLRPMTRQQVGRIVKEACDEVGLEGSFSTHTLRKTWGYQAFQKGIRLTDIQRKLGHRHQAVTHDYIGLTDDDIQRVSEEVDL
ncbi:MAG: tyrosine-type recombinase/integrase [Acidobacteria bacterium]|nr:tyrosine-type recombinase/integrase [Acidobacteriota bacterium]